MGQSPADIPWLDNLRSLAEAAGRAIAEVHRRTGFGTRAKADASPVTDADLASQELILDGLYRLAPDLPCLSEEAAAASWSERRTWRRYWLVDPLDGTREFVSGRDEFTVNIALVEDGAPVLGVVHAPMLGRTWLGAVGQGAWCVESGKPAAEPRALTPDPDPPRPGPPVVAVSFSHRSALIDRYLDLLPSHRLLPMGSSLKICLVAEGRADLYPRLGRTMEWDTAAAHAVLAAAGGRVVDSEGRSLRYNKEDLVNPFFIAWRRSRAPWRDAWSRLHAELAGDP